MHILESVHSNTPKSIYWGRFLPIFVKILKCNTKINENIYVENKAA